MGRSRECRQQRIVCRGQIVEIVAQGRKNREPAVEQRQLARDENAAEPEVGRGEGAGRESLARGRLGPVAQPLLTRPADIPANDDRGTQCIVAKGTARFCRKPINLVFEGVQTFAVGARCGASRNRRTILVGELGIRAILVIGGDMRVIDRAFAGIGPVERDSRTLGIVARGQIVDDPAWERTEERHRTLS